MSTIPDPQNHIKAMIQCLFIDHSTVARNWGIYLQDRKFDDEPELRNKIFAIWVTSLLDPVLNEASCIPQYRNRALQLNLKYLLRYLDQAEYYFSKIRDVLSVFSKQEQLFIFDFRNQIVHGHLKGRHTEERTVRWVESSLLHTEKLSRKEIEELLRPIYERGSVDSTLLPLREKFLGGASLYWAILDELVKNRKAIGNAINANFEYDFETIPL